MACKTYDVQGNHWYVTHCELVIPERGVEGMTAREIGEHILSLLPLIPAIRDEEFGGSGYGRALSLEEIAARKLIPRESRDRVYRRLIERDGACCQVPGCLAEENFHIDHIVPRSNGGSNKLSNLQLLCARHNLQKNNRSWQEFLEAI